MLQFFYLSGQNFEQKIEDLDQYIENARKYWKVPGMSVAVIKEGKVLLAKGYGQRQLGGKMVDENTIFNIGSTTKAFTSVLIGMLVDQGLLHWEDKVIDYMPEFQLHNPYTTRDARVKDLLTHNLGLGNADFLWGTQSFTKEEILSQIRNLPMSYPLRGGYTYQNIMYHAAGLLIEKITGMTWEKAMKKMIFEPLEMTNTYADKELSQSQANRSIAHHYVDEKITPIKDFNADSIAAAGATWSSIKDMAKWTHFLLDSARVDGIKLLKTETWAELFKPQALIPQNQFYPTTALTKPKWTTYGLGFFQQDYGGKALDFHTGSLPGTMAMIGLIHEEKVGYYFLGNLDHAEVRHALMYKVFDEFGNTGIKRDWSVEMKKLYDGINQQVKNALARQDANRIEGTSPSQALENYAGDYQHPVWGKIEVRWQQNQLKMTYSKYNFGRLEHWHYDTFRFISNKKWSYPSNITFQQNSNGKIVELSLGQNYVFKKI